MITMQTAESALKSIYLDSVVNEINTKTNPFLTMVQRNAKRVNGKDAKSTIRFGNKNSVVAGVEGGNLPTNAGGRVAEIVSPVKNIYGTFQVSDKAIRASQNDASAFSTLIGDEMKNLIGTAKNNMNDMLYGNGWKLIAYGQSFNPTLNEFEIQPLKIVATYINTANVSAWRMARTRSTRHRRSLGLYVLPVPQFARAVMMMFRGFPPSAGSSAYKSAMESPRLIKTLRITLRR